MTTTPFARRMAGVQASFIREILKVTRQPDVISFAGGLPSPDLFPGDALRQSADYVLRTEAHSALQYSATEGCPDLREWIAGHYQSEFGISIPASNILITNGSQQGLDLLGKIFLDPGDGVVIEAPAYLGALQALTMYQPRFLPVRVDNNGMDIVRLKTRLDADQPKLVYTVPDFQNPSGICYPQNNRQQVADLINQSSAYLIEDSPYTELRFSGQHKSLLYSLTPEKTILLGSFSKTLSPSLRLGWIVASHEIMHKLRLAKQAADLHSSFLLQRIVLHYLTQHSHQQHIRTICQAYAGYKQTMLNAITDYFPDGISVTNPEGGMFLWVTLNKECLAMDLFEASIKHKVAFVPGESFYYTDAEKNTMRLNYTSADKNSITKGVKILGNILRTSP